ncbi:magnesium-translocating P-type ATPase [Erwinia sp. BC051422]|uniref:magnesium-translocating P-type ATPase n=1 Tax=Erwinia wuhanensis TaxID=3045167 RepID=UPI0026562308|nr:magnesium-translocating P-type ATPase [Erwinia sp. BC051422]MDN8542876.1 magnesium-translocating P-type ATPase [Erwinia sp. BC051422]
MKKSRSRDLAIAQEIKLSLDSTLARLHTQRNGLTAADASERLLEYGKNEVATAQAPHALIQLIQAFNNPFIWILIVLAAISFFTDYLLPLRQGEETDLTGIIIMLTMVALSGLLRFWQEYRTNKAAEALKSLVRTTATAIRRSSENAAPVRMEVALQDVVPGDVIFLSAGDMVPADVRLLTAKDLFISQASLSGEAVPVEKHAASDRCQPDDDLLNRPDICLMGTSVASGTATAVVVTTGNRTWFGSLAKSVTGSRPQTAFDRGVNSVSWLLVRFMLAMVPVVLFINGFTKGDWADATLFALAVAVGLTPEMLPMIVSSNLAKGAIALSRRKVVVKRLNAIQNFSAMDVLCTDKTGTLTQDRIILAQHLDAHGHSSDRVLQLAWLNSRHQTGVKNLMDRAILSFSQGKWVVSGLHRYRKIDELPFDFERRRLSIVVADEHDRQKLICKGAAGEMLSVATHWQDGRERRPLDEAARQQWSQQAARWNQQGFRVLLIGERDLSDMPLTLPLHKDDERDLTLCGLLTFLDPPKESAREAIAALHEHGVTVKVLTGDNAIITSKICRDVGLEPGEPLCGSEIERLDDRELATLADSRTIFCRLTPLQKSRVLNMLQQNGHTVGFLGDGINDAPALREADVGISVDSATDIAKESADIILLEKNLMVLEQGVIKGRETFGNIIKYLNMTASSNFGNVFSVLIASAFLPFLPMLAIQLLIQNLMYDLSQLALPWDKMDKAFLRKPRKWDARNIGRFMLWMGPTSSLFDVTTFLLMWNVFAANSVEHQALFQSGWFVEGLLSQTLVVHMLRTQKIPFIQSRAALPVMLMTGLVMALGIAIPFSPLGEAVGLTPLPWTYFPWLVATLLGYCLVTQGMKRLYIRRFGQWF